MTDIKKDTRSAYTNEFEIKLPYLTQLLDVCQEIKEETRIRMKEAMGSEKVRCLGLSLLLELKHRLL